MEVLGGEDLMIYDTSVNYQNRANAYGVQGPKGWVMTNVYPPFVAFFMIPFSLFPYDSARYVFFLFSILCNIFTIPLLFSNRSRDRRKELILIGLFATFIFYPHYRSLNMGQINSIIFLFCVLTLFFIRKDRLWLAGLFLALASHIKLFPLILIPFFAIKKQYKLIGTTIVFIVLIIALTAIFLDIKLFRIFFKEVLPREAFVGAFYRSQGFLGFFSRLLTENRFVQSIGHYPNLAYFLTVASSVIVIFAAVLCTRRKPDLGTFRYEIEYGMYFVVTLLILAKSWEHFAIFLLFSYLYLFEFLVYQRYENSRRQLVLFFIALSFCIWTFLITAESEYIKFLSLDNFLVTFIFSAKFLATLILLICNFWILHKKQEDALLVQTDSQSSKLFK
ncbi:MAG: DUF2029 domain-containing protein [Candidatus Mariimomonas ferrooxydans]